MLPARLFSTPIRLVRPKQSRRHARVASPSNQDRGNSERARSRERQHQRRKINGGEGARGSRGGIAGATGGDKGARCDFGGDGGGDGEYAGGVGSSRKGPSSLWLCQYMLFL